MCWRIQLTHWGRVTHICVGNLTIIGSDNGLSPGRRQAITWTNVGILLIGTLGTNFSEMLIEIHTFSFKKIHLKMSSGKWRPFCPGLNVLKDFHMHIMDSHSYIWKFSTTKKMRWIWESTILSCQFYHLQSKIDFPIGLYKSQLLIPPKRHMIIRTKTNTYPIQLSRSNDIVHMI